MTGIRKKIILLLVALCANYYSIASVLTRAGEDFLSPFTTDAKYTMYTGLASTAFLYLGFNNNFIKDTQDEAQENKPLGRFSKWGDLAGQLYPNALYFIGMTSAYLITKNERYKGRAQTMLKSSLYSGVLTTVLKHVVREKRPGDSKSRLSFPSGHTAMAFAFAGTIGIEHEWYYSVPAYLIAGLVGYSRINDNAHFLHDVLAGATIGLSYALGVHYMAQKRKLDISKHNFTPLFDGDTVGIGYVYNF